MMILTFGIDFNHLLRLWLIQVLLIFDLEEAHNDLDLKINRMTLTFDLVCNHHLRLAIIIVFFIIGALAAVIK